LGICPYIMFKGLEPLSRRLPLSKSFLILIKELISILITLKLSYEDLIGVYFIAHHHIKDSG